MSLFILEPAGYPPKQFGRPEPKFITNLGCLINLCEFRLGTTFYNTRRLALAMGRAIYKEDVDWQHEEDDSDSTVGTDESTHINFEVGDCGLSHRTQPWKQFWPPKSGSAMLNMLKTQEPEVLTCRFDISRPFDRPWRRWTTPATVEEVDCTVEVASRLGRSTPPGRVPASANLPNTGTIRDELDQQLEKLRLPTARPSTFSHLAPVPLYQHEKPYKCQLPENLFKEYKMHNLVAMNHTVAINDISGHEDFFSLAVSGFEFARCPVDVGEWSDKRVSDIYLPRLVEWLKERLGCRDVFCYAYNFRQHSTSLEEAQAGQKFESKLPFFRAHCDATEATCRARLQLYFPDCIDDIMKDRVRFINIWRPISPAPVEDCPLAMCDFRTVDRDDLVPMDIVYPHFVDEAYEVKHNPAHRWFYKKGMQQEDVIVFKLFDSLTSEATVCPHSAFVDPSAPADAPRRASIEVKAIVLG
ncbi:hypothetical protein QBC36DRAFT_328522 [Triangularia setosa]|uniref:Uncharacterized protein n=1 Tax=Triangularia setosa TaxID=2587417 RepID=A0AAN7A872_9PEZI|nr:hypothetical protein QBC36DRAFT_328522 [Podospora setosa]